MHEPLVVNFGMKDREGCFCVPIVGHSNQVASITKPVKEHLHCRYIPHDIDGNNCQHLLSNVRFLVSLKAGNDNS